MVVQIENVGEVIATDCHVGAVAHADLVDLTEQLVGGIARRDIGETGFHSHAAQRQQSPLLPLGIRGELLVAELHAALAVGTLRVRSRQGHRHVEIAGAAGEAGVEDRHHEAWVCGVQDDVDPFGLDQRDDGRPIRRIEPRWGHAGIVETIDGSASAGIIDVGEDQSFEERPAGDDGSEGGADPTGADDEDAHRRSVGPAQPPVP